MDIKELKDSKEPTTRRRKKNTQDQQQRSTALQRSASTSYSQHSESHSQSQSQSFSPSPSPSHAEASYSSNSNSSWSDTHYGKMANRQLGRSLYGIVSYLWDLILGTVIILRPLFSFLLALVVIILLLATLTRSLSIFRSEIQARVVCKIPLVSSLIDCSRSSSSSDLGMLHIPNFAELVNKQAASYEMIADTLSALNPGFLPKNKRKRVRDKLGRLLGRKSKPKGSSGSSRTQGESGSGGWDLSGNTAGEEGEGDGGEEEEGEGEEADDPYGLSVHTRQSGPPMAMLLKRAELAVVDLKVLVKHSTLAEEAKELLVGQLQAFHTRAKTTTRQMQFLQARANGCVDGLVIRNVYLRIELDQLERQQRRLLGGGSEEGLGLGVGRVWDRVLDFFAGTLGMEIAASEKKLQQLYVSTMEDARNHIRDLIMQSQEVLQSLDMLDQILSSIHEIGTQERRQQNRAHEETLAMLWSRLGGNRLQRTLYRENLEFLQDLDGQRKATVGQIQAALWKLTEFEAEIGVLRERIVDAAVGVAMTGEEGPKMVRAPEDGGGDGGGLGTGGVSTLRTHIEQIDLVTSRLKGRSFLGGAMVKAQQESSLS